jgi:hypothetical protein
MGLKKGYQKWHFRENDEDINVPLPHQKNAGIIKDVHPLRNGVLL